MMRFMARTAPEPKSAQLVARVTSNDLKALRRMAKRQDLTVGEVVRRILRAAIDREAKTSE
jgi:hypothetical protein